MIFSTKSQQGHKPNGIEIELKTTNLDELVKILDNEFNSIISPVDKYSDDLGVHFTKRRKLILKELYTNMNRTDFEVYILRRKYDKNTNHFEGDDYHFLNTIKEDSFKFSKASLEKFCDEITNELTDILIKTMFKFVSSHYEHREKIIKPFFSKLVEYYKLKESGMYDIKYVLKAIENLDLYFDKAINLLELYKDKPKEIIECVFDKLICGSDAKLDLLPTINNLRSSEILNFAESCKNKPKAVVKPAFYAIGIQLYGGIPSETIDKFNSYDFVNLVEIYRNKPEEVIESVFNVVCIYGRCYLPVPHIFSDVINLAKLYFDKPDEVTKAIFNSIYKFYNFGVEQDGNNIIFPALYNLRREEALVLAESYRDQPKELTKLVFEGVTIFGSFSRYPYYFIDEDDYAKSALFPKIVEVASLCRNKPLEEVLRIFKTMGKVTGCMHDPKYDKLLEFVDQAKHELVNFK